MKCRICGAQLRKDGDLCKQCYEEYCKEEELEKDVNERYKIYRKYIPAYQLTQYVDWYFISLFILIALIAQARYGYAILFLIFAIVVLGVVLFYTKKAAINTICTFYDKKIVWENGEKKKILAYSDLKEITYYQNFFQKIFKLADVQFHPEGGSYLISGFEVKNVPNFDDTWENIQEIIISKREE